MEGSTPPNSAHQRQGNPMSDKKCTFIERDKGQSRGYLPWWGEVLLDPVGNMTVEILQPLCLEGVTTIRTKRRLLTRCPMTSWVARETLTEEDLTERVLTGTILTTAIPAKVEGTEPRRPMDASREASLDRAAQSSGSDTLDGGSPMPSRPPSPLPNNDNMDSGPHCCLKTTVYEMTCKGR